MRQVEYLNACSIVVACAVSVNVARSYLYSIATQVGHPLKRAYTAEFIHTTFYNLNAESLSEVVVDTLPSLAARLLKIANNVAYLVELPAARLTKLARHNGPLSFFGFTLVTTLYKSNHNGIITSISTTKIQRLSKAKVELRDIFGNYCTEG